MNWSIGDKAVAIGKVAGIPSTADDPSKRVVGIYPQRGDVLVVAAISAKGGLCFIGSTVIYNGFEVGWHPACFRRLDELKKQQSIAIQKSISDRA